MKKQKTNKRILIRTVIVFAVCLLAISGIVGAVIRSGVEREKNRAQYTAEAATRRVEAQIRKYLVVSEILENLVKAGYEISSEDFGIISELMMDNEGVIEAIEYAPDGEVSYVYPLKGNEAAIGLNLLKNPAREKEANLARSSGQYTIAGPFELTQGGMGALLLDPIYLSDDEETENFWGFSVLVLNWDAFLREVELENMESSGYHYLLWHISPSTGEKLVIAECEEQDMGQALRVVGEVPNDIWYFEIMPDVGWVTSWQWMISIVCIGLVSLLLSFGYWQYAIRQYQERVYTEELEKAAEEAKSANEAKTRFLFNMSHDIRTPMNAILGFTNMAEENLSDQEKVQDCLGKVEMAGRELLDLINEVLNISRIESGTMKPVMESADLYDLSQTMKLLFEQSMAAKGIQLEVVTEIRDSCVICDMQHMREICVNLLSNAQKFTPEGGKVIFGIRQKEFRQEGFGEYEVFVSDTGIGMSEEFQKIQFELFEREESKHVSEIEGTGLGLPIVKRLVGMLGAAISCASEKGKGTTYTLTFRLEQGEQETSPENEDVDMTLKHDDAFEGKHVLLVEDNELNREIALYLLQDMGFRVDIAEDGVQAVEKVKASEKDLYDLILMDVHMPNMNGYEATIAIRKLENSTLAAIPVIAMTANAFEDDKKHAFAAGMNGHISKPVEVPKLVNALAEILK